MKTALERARAVCDHETVAHRKRTCGHCEAIAEAILAAVNDALDLFGAEEMPDGSLKINMPKYHAVHRCEAHRKAPYRTQDLDVCVPCLRGDPK